MEEFGHAGRAIKTINCINKGTKQIFTANKHAIGKGK
jgi:hypothetical protein